MSNSSWLPKFFSAVYSNQISAVKLLLKRHKTDPNIPDDKNASGRTALLFACQHQRLALAEVLLTSKPIPADVNKGDNNDRRPVWWAAQHGDVELADLLVKRFKCEVDFIDRKTGCTPLYRAIVTGNADVCAILIHGGADVNLRRLGYGVGAQSPLMKAVQMDNLPICQVLVNSLCKLNYTTDEGFNALHYAVAYHRYNIAEFLLENNIKKHATSNNGVTAMTIGIEHFNPALVQILIQHGYNMNKEYRWKETPLAQAIAFHSQDCAMALVHWGCSLSSRSKAPTYLRMAADAGMLRLVEFITKVNPQSLQESWICKRDWPLALTSTPWICHTLSSLCSTPLSLMDHCRSAIFKYVPYFPKRYLRLPLPDELLKFLSFSDIIDTRMYKRTELKKECPSDCDFLHAWRESQCPDIEVSDIDGLTDYSSDDDSDILDGTI